MKLKNVDTLPKLDGILRYHEDLIHKKERDRDSHRAGSRRPKNNSLQVEGVSKVLANDIKIDLRKEKDEVRKYLNRIHHGGNRPEQNKVSINRGLPPLRR